MRFRRLTRYSALVALAVLVLSVSAQARSVSIIGPFQNWAAELDEAFARFTEKTGVEVEVILATSWPDLYEKVVTMSAAGVPPDVVYGDNLRIMDLGERGLLKALDPLAEADPLDLSRYPALVLDGLRIRGRLYSLPTAISIHANLYNVDLFQAMGVPPLPTDWLGPELTWDEFVEMSKKFTVVGSDGTASRFGLAAFGYSGGFNMIGLWGVQDVDPDRTRYLGTDPAVIRALEQTTGLWTEHQVVGGSFYNQTAAMWPVQPVVLNELLRLRRSGDPLNWRAAILPMGTTRASQASFHSLGITVNALNEENAWALVKFLAYDPEGVVLFTRAENRVPVLRESAMDFVDRWSREFPEGDVHVYTEAVQVLWDWRIISGAGASEILQYMTQAWNLIRTGQSSVSDAIHQIAPLVNAALQRGN